MLRGAGGGAVGPYSGVTRVPLALCAGWRGDWGLEAGQDPRGMELGLSRDGGGAEGEDREGPREGHCCSHS